MHVHLAQVIRDLSGVTGLAMRRALRAGARDPARLAAFTDDRINARTHTLATRREGHGRDAWLCHLRPARERDACDQQNIAACDPQLEAHLLTVARKIEGAAPPLPTPTRRPQNARRHEPHGALHPPRSRISGVDLTRSDGLEVRTAHTRMAEIGLEMSRWKRDTHVASWLG